MDDSVIAYTVKTNWCIYYLDLYSRMTSYKIDHVCQLKTPLPAYTYWLREVKKVLPFLSTWIYLQYLAFLEPYTLKQISRVSLCFKLYDWPIFISGQSDCLKPL